jgi:hypothetical protein
MLNVKQENGVRSGRMCGEHGNVMLVRLCSRLKLQGDVKLVYLLPEGIIVEHVYEG